MNRMYSILFATMTLFLVSACDLVPKEAVELSNTVGKDLVEMHRAHRALAELHFGKSKMEVNRFIDEQYRPAFIAKFASEFQLDKKVKLAMNTAPDELLGGLTVFVRIAHERIEKKRQELLGPIAMQENEVLRVIDVSHRQIQSAHAIVTGHLASVRKVREVQNELLANVGLEGARKKIASVSANVSNKVNELTILGQEIDRKIDDINAQRMKAKQAILTAKETLALRIKSMDQKISEVRNAL